QYSNHLGSACLELDNQSEIVSYEEYHPYGTSAYQALNGSIEAPPKRYRYTGTERDGETGLSYHSARYYMTGFARWISADPSDLRNGPNMYRYAPNPVVFNDQTGREDWEVVNPENKDTFATVKKKAVEEWQSGTDPKDRSTRFFLEIQKKYPSGISGTHA